MAKSNIADDFAEAIQKEQDTNVQRGIPPLHPKEKDKWINLAEEEPIPGLIDHNLLQLPKHKLKARLRRFCVSDLDEVEQYEKIQDRCLEGKGWILAREEWTTDKDGETYIIIKYLEPQEIEESKKGSDGE